MRLNATTLTAAALLSISVATHGADNQLTDSERDAGWQLLFDGESFAQWRNYGSQDVNALWQIDDGAMLVSERGAKDLITRKTWRNFELQLEWRVAEGGNSGIFFLADESDKPVYVHAPEVQILDNERHSDRKQADRRSGSIYDLVAAPAASQRPAGDWNHVILRHENQRLQVWQNGVQTADIVIGGTEWNTLVAASKFADWDGFGENASGHLGLQDHGDRVWFKNLKVLDLDTDDE